MLSIPATYYKNNEDYITLPAIKSFMRAHSDGKFKLSMPREDLMNSIITYANQSDDHAEVVLNWIDEVLQEGIKDIYLQYAPLPEKLQLLFTTENGITNYLQVYTDRKCSKHICLNNYNEDYRLINTSYVASDMGRKLVFIYCKKLHMHDKKKQHTKVIDYPVVAEYSIDSHWLLVRAKPRSNLYVFNPEGFLLEDAESTTTEKQIREVVDLVSSILEIEKFNKSYASELLKNNIFNLLHKYSNTPAEIAKIMDEKAEKIASVSESIQALCTVPEHCVIPGNMTSDIDEDITNIIEKYLSINWNDKYIFIRDREAYPVKLSATDEEESKVEQTAAMEEPLQTKALFFDNKKMLYKSKRCDGVVFQWKRKDPTPFTKDSFTVRIFVNQRGHCIFKFSEYTAKEDIENVIFSIIGTEKNTK